VLKASIGPADIGSSVVSLALVFATPPEIRLEQSMPAGATAAALDQQASDVIDSNRAGAQH